MLVDETDLPLIDEGADRILFVHMLEWSEHPLELLREIWRVLAPNGRVYADRSQSPRHVGESRHHPVRLWQSVQPEPAYAALEAAWAVTA